MVAGEFSCIKARKNSNVEPLWIEIGIENIIGWKNIRIKYEYNQIKI